MPPYFKMPTNLILSIRFSDEQASGANAAGDVVLTYIATGGEFSFQDDLLIGATVKLVFRDGLAYNDVDDFTPAKEYMFDALIGTITFPPDPFPAMEPGEVGIVSYVAASGQIDIAEPITLATARGWLKVTGTEEDDLITGLISAARGVCEDVTGISFVQRTITAELKNELGGVRIPYGPVTAIASVYDNNNLAITDYTIQGDLTKRILLPVTCYLKVNYTAGYYVLPEKLKLALRMQLAWMYVHRGDESITPIAPDAMSILNRYKVKS